jgi:drug/metabolite transporter (DMT)-like permease
MVLVVVLHSLLGFTITLSKIILAHASPIFLVSARMMIAGVVLLLLSARKHWNKFAPEKVDWVLLAQFTLFGIMIPHISRTWALQHVSTVKTALIYNLAPFFSAIFAYFLFREKLTKLKIIGLIVGFVGTLPILINGNMQNTALNCIGCFSIPDFFIMLAVASLSYSFFIMQQLVRHRNCPPFIANGLSMLAGGFLAFNASYIAEPVWIKGRVTTFAALLILNIIVSNIICANLQAWLLKKHSSTFIAFASFLSPIFAAIYGAILLDEGFALHFVISFVLVLVGLTLYFYDELVKKPDPTSPVMQKSASQPEARSAPLHAKSPSE